MAGIGPQKHLLFGTYDLDCRAGELRKQGVKLKLQEQPLDVLLILLEKPGEIVSREELQQKIWPPIRSLTSNTVSTTRSNDCARLWATTQKSPSTSRRCLVGDTAL